MTLAIDPADLRPALRLAQMVVARRNTIPVLDTVRLTAPEGDETLTIRATDLDIEAAVTMPRVGRGALDICLSPKRLALACIDNDDPIRIAADDETLSIEAGPARQTLRNLYPATDFPAWGCDSDAAVTIQIGEADLNDALRNVAPCISAKETRYYLGGVYLDPTSTCAVATDGRRLACFDLPALADMPQGAILPRKTVRLLLRLLRPGGNRIVTAECHAAAGEGEGAAGILGMTFRIGDVRLSTRLIDGAFPNYRQVIPQNAREIDVTVTRTAVRRLGPVGDRIAVEIDPKAGTLAVRDKSGDHVCVQGQIGKGATFGLNISYLAELLSRHDPVRLMGNSPRDPFVACVEDPRLTHIIMPMLL